MRIAPLLFAPLLIGLAMHAPIGVAAEPAMPDWQRQLQEGADRLGRQLQETLDHTKGEVELLLRQVPRYELPQMDANGDIIIRRKPPPQPDWPPLERTSAPAARTI